MHQCTNAPSARRGKTQRMMANKHWDFEITQVPAKFETNSHHKPTSCFSSGSGEAFSDHWSVLDLLNFIFFVHILEPTVVLISNFAGFENTWSTGLITYRTAFAWLWQGFRNHNFGFRRSWWTSWNVMRGTCVSAQQDCIILVYTFAVLSQQMSSDTSAKALSNIPFAARYRLTPWQIYWKHLWMLLKWSNPRPKNTYFEWSPLKHSIWHIFWHSIWQDFLAGKKKRGQLGRNLEKLGL